MQIAKIKCLFCENVISFVDGDLGNFQTHLEYDHEIMLRKNFVLALSFLIEDEIEVIASKMVARMEYFLEHGIVSVVGNDIFNNEIETEEITIVEERINEYKQEPSVKIKEEKEKVVSIKPCNIMIKKMVPTNEDVDSDDDDDFDDLDLHQQKILQNVDYKMEIGESEVCDEEDVNAMIDNDLEMDNSQIAEQNTNQYKQKTGKIDLKSINLVDKFTSLNQCRLCFSCVSNLEELRSHEETYHAEHRDELNISFFTLKDLSFRCDLCPQIPGFLSENVLNFHKKLQHRIQVKNTVVKCEICQKVVKSQSLRGHMLIHSEKKFECNLCYKKFIKMKYLQNHQKSRHPHEAQYYNRFLKEADLVFNCDVCNLRFITENVLDYHKKAHEKRTLLNCEFCASSFEHPKLFKIHCTKVHGKRASIDGSDKKFKCKLCRTGFARTSYLEAHVKIHKEDQDALERTLTDEDLKVTCGECDQKFVSKHILKYHVNKNHKQMEFEELRRPAFDEEDKKYKCKLCYTRFDKFSVLHSHIMASHVEDKMLLKNTITEEDLNHGCDECDQRFISVSVLEYHKTKVHVKKDKFVKCKICLKVVKRYSFSGHRLTHTSERDVECQLCYVKLKGLRILKEHQKKKHGSDIEQEYILTGNGQDEFQYNCETCNLKFLTENLLLNHQKQHTLIKQKNFNCQFCPILFFKFKAYKKHAAEVHKKELPSRQQTEKEYGCKLCYRKFNYKKSLKDHTNKIHEHDLERLLHPILDDDLVFDCGKCDQKFISCNIMEYHDKISHKAQKQKFEVKSKTRIDKECKLCYVKFRKRSYLLSHHKSAHKSETEFLERELMPSDFKYNCNLCEKKFVTDNILKRHSKMHKTDNYEFLRNEVYDDKDKLFRCKLCYAETKYFRDFVAHLSSFHRDDTELLAQKIEGKDLVYGCGECDLKFIRKLFLEYHSSKCHNMDPSNSHCKLCNVTYKTNNGFMQHKFRIHKNELSAFLRDYEEDDMVYDCTSCDKKCATQTALDYHTSRTHSTGKKIKVKLENLEKYCRLCYVLYKDPKYLRMHKKKIHAGEMDAFEKDLTEESMQYNCSTCEKSFYSQNTLDYHRQRKHKSSLGNDEFHCKLCYISFPFNSVWKRHLNMLHRDDMHLFEEDIHESMLGHHCQNCEKRFVGEHILKYHNKYQHRDMKYKKDPQTNQQKEPKDRVTFCKLCHVDFKIGKQFRAHKEKIHKTQEEIVAFDVKMEMSSLPYKCKFCNKKFLTKNILRYHNIYSHKEQRRQDMSCEFCNQVFKWTRDRNRVMANHMRNKHQVIDFEADELEPVQKENDTVKNFMFLLNSLHK